MGKRAKKKVQTAPGKLVAGSRIASSNPASTSSPSDSGNRLGENSSALTETGCPHSANIDKLRGQLNKTSAIHCVECAKLRSGPAGGKERRVKGKPLKKKAYSQSAVSPLSEEKVSTHKLWICLSCGHAGCGAGSSPGTNASDKFVARQGVVGRGHAWQHWLQLKHPMVMQCGDEFVCWCFQCEVAYELKNAELETIRSSEVESEKTTEMGTQKSSEVETQKSSEVETENSPKVESQKSSEDGVDGPVAPSRAELLQQCAKVVQKKLVEQMTEVKGPSVNAPDQEVGKSQNVASQGNVAIDEGEAGKPKRIIKGLLNLGNTCFFNSVMQNLLGLEILRNYFLEESASFEGPLTTSLRKFFQEITVQPQAEPTGMNGLEGGLKRVPKARGGWSGMDGVHNPKGLFGAICAKVPRFKGYQQQDSHELLKCLLDGLHTEEETTRKLLTAAGKKVDDRGNGMVANVGDAEHRSISFAQENGTDGQEKVKQGQGETFVERVFGGQLSSTVSCCECGHSSVVYEPFLDLSLSIPAKKTSPRPTPLQSVSEQGTHRIVSSVAKNQRIQTFKSKGSLLRVKTSDSNDLDDDDVLNASQIAGLGTPILLLPPPPPKCNSVDNFTLSTVSDDTSWLDFVDDSEDLESQVTYGCAPNPEGYVSCGAPSPSLYGSGFSISPDFEMIEGCVANGASVKQAGISDGDIASLHALSAHRFEEIDDEGGMDGSLVSADHNLDTPPSEKLLLLEAPRQSWSEVHFHSNWFDSERSNFNSSNGLGEDGFIQIKGGSESQVLLLTQGEETDFLAPEPVVENSRYPGASAEQFSSCGNDSNLHSENVIGPCDTGIPLESTQGDREVGTDQEAQGDYDGVASLFEEDEEYGPSYGPFPLNHDASGYEGSGGFEEVCLDDVLDLGKISCEGRDDWLVCTNDRQEDDSEEVTMSLEGCLQIFTRPEVLSGENAWGCENCTSKYHEKLAAALVKSSVTVPPKDSAERISRKETLDNGNLLSDISDLDTSGREKTLNSGSQGDLGTDQEANGVDKDIATDYACTSDHLLEKELSCAGTEADCVAVKGHLTENVKVRSDGSSASPPATSAPPISDGNGEGKLSPGHHDNGVEALDDAGLEKTQNVESRVGNIDTRQENGDLLSVRSTCDGAELPDLPSSCSSNGLVNTIDKGRDVSGNQCSNSSDDAEGDEFGRSEAEGGTRESEKTSSSSSSGRRMKPTKCRSKNAEPEPRKVIKQEATKRYLISKAPPVLVVQLKRFARDMRGRLSKLYGPVSFQEWLDLSPYVDHRHVTSHNCRYRLTGTVEHTGTLKGGHYVAYVRGPQASTAGGLKHEVTGNASRESSWYHISDSYVRQTSLDAVLKSEAYLLFYERC